MQEILQAQLLLEINCVQLLELPPANGVYAYELRYRDYAGRPQRAIFFDYASAEAEFVRSVEEEDYRG